jgi:hypothetical protein
MGTTRSAESAKTPAVRILSQEFCQQESEPSVLFEFLSDYGLQGSVQVNDRVTAFHAPAIEGQGHDLT